MIQDWSYSNNYQSWCLDFWMHIKISVLDFLTDLPRNPVLAESHSKDQRKRATVGYDAEMSLHLSISQGTLFCIGLTLSPMQVTPLHSLCLEVFQMELCGKLSAISTSNRFVKIQTSLNYQEHLVFSFQLCSFFFLNISRPLGAVSETSLFQPHVDTPLADNSFSDATGIGRKYFSHLPQDGLS